MQYYFDLKNTRKVGIFRMDMLDANDFSQELTFIMIKRALLLLLLTAVWAFGSWWYYTCMIKGFCRADGAFTSAADRAKTIAATGAAAVAVTATGLTNDEAATPEPLESEPTTDTSDQATPSTTSEFIDQDNDAISDEDERRLGTNPASDDSDGVNIRGISIPASAAASTCANWSPFVPSADPALALPGDYYMFSA